MLFSSYFSPAVIFYRDACILCISPSVPVGNVLQPGAGALMARVAHFLRSESIACTAVQVKDNLIAVLSHSISDSCFSIPVGFQKRYLSTLSTGSAPLGYKHSLT